ncbi:MAG: CDGSH iron-sulfur domain-containing protein [Mariniblastus sp.]|nr:CDGSH iron-sulfur domain-containing protein [Mariniblastus sp.]
MEENSKPIVAACFPKQVEIEAGKKYAYCTCGISENQPFCDGKHSGTSFKPMVFEATESETAYYCQCKHTGNAPKCDGTHKTVEQNKS